MRARPTIAVFLLLAAGSAPAQPTATPKPRACDLGLERDRLVRAFFRSPEPVRALAIARSMDARFVYLTGPQKVDFDPRGALEPLFERGSERVYRILPFDGRGREGRAAAGPR
jgi:hypothetical protein